MSAAYFLARPEISATQFLVLGGETLQGLGMSAAYFLAGSLDISSFLPGPRRRSISKALGCQQLTSWQGPGISAAFFQVLGGEASARPWDVSSLLPGEKLQYPQ